MNKALIAVLAVFFALTSFAKCSPERAEVARRCAAESIVLLKNDGVLPLATAFPATALTSCSFDPVLQEEYGRVLGAEAVEFGIDIHLAPGICLARHPMCGRNFEYMGEDPYLAGRIDIRRIRASARRVLELVMASPRFKATL